MTHCENLTLPGLPVINEVYYTGLSVCGNCKIYPVPDEEDKRPESCYKYRCAWLFGHGNENDRPDKSLILFDESKNIENCLEAKPLTKDIEISKNGTNIINRMSISSGKPVVVLNFYEQRVIRIAGRPVEEK